MENTLFFKDYPRHILFEPMPLNGNWGTQQIGSSNGALRLASMFFDLLEKQFPASSPTRKMKYRFPVDFAEALSVHVNHLNRCIKDITGKTTSQQIADRIVAEASVLLYGSKWNVCEIGYCFGFDEGPHFINFFKKKAKMSPTAYRKMVRLKNPSL